MRVQKVFLIGVISRKRQEFWRFIQTLDSLAEMTREDAARG